jgi:hypothetical protein
MMTSMSRTPSSHGDVAPSQYQVDATLWKTLFNNHHEPLDAYDPSLPNGQLVRFCEDKELDVIDLLPILKKETQSGRTLYHAREQHWNIEGNAIVAQVVAYAFKERLKN